MIRVQVKYVQGSDLKHNAIHFHKDATRHFLSPFGALPGRWEIVLYIGRIVCVNWQFYICLGRCGDHFLSWDLFDSRDHRHLVWDLFDPALDQFHHRGLRTLPRLWVPRQWGRGGTLLGIKIILSLTIKPFHSQPGPCSPFFCECTHGEIRIKKALACVLEKVKHAFYLGME